MKCKSIESWTFSLLVGAYVDLAIAYCLLCGSTFAYFASMFLGVFGLSLPCPCNDNSGNPNIKRCSQQMLSNDPFEKISSVHYLVKKRYPFNSVFTGETNRNFDSEGVEDEGEASCSPCTNKAGVGKRNHSGVISVSFPVVEDGGIVLQGNRYSLLRRSKSISQVLAASSVSSYDMAWSDTFSVPQSPSDINGFKEKVAESDRLAADSPDDGVVSSDLGLYDISCHGFELSEPVEKKRHCVKDQVVQGEVRFNGEKDVIKALTRALEEEHSACQALQAELEKERSAAASAADEALAMMLRLQEEKASTAMEARQYKRIAEGKSAYDAEEMSILKEILVRREREKHFLEKEVEEYRRMMIGNETPDDVPMLRFGNESAGMKKDDAMDGASDDYKLLATDIHGSEELNRSDDNMFVRISSNQEIEISENSSESHKYWNISATGDGKLSSCSRSCSDLTTALPSSLRKSLQCDFRRNSMSSADYERLKIDDEVELLRERLRIVQEGREKFSFSIGCKDMRKSRLQLQED